MVWYVVLVIIFKIPASRRPGNNVCILNAILAIIIVNLRHTLHLLVPRRLRRFIVSLIILRSRLPPWYGVPRLLLLKSILRSHLGNLLTGRVPIAFVHRGVLQASGVRGLLLGGSLARAAWVVSEAEISLCTEHFEGAFAEETKVIVVDDLCFIEFVGADLELFEIVVVLESVVHDILIVPFFYIIGHVHALFFILFKVFTIEDW